MIFGGGFDPIGGGKNKENCIITTPKFLPDLKMIVPAILAKKLFVMHWQMHGWMGGQMGWTDGRD